MVNTSEQTIRTHHKANCHDPKIKLAKYFYVKLFMILFFKDTHKMIHTVDRVLFYLLHVFFLFCLCFIPSLGKGLEGLF